MKSITTWVLGTLVVGSFVLSPPRGGTLRAQESRKVEIKATPLEDEIAGVLPRAGEELWNTIPWRFDFAAARAEANREGKPMFVWMMNGNPLGCT